MNLVKSQDTKLIHRNLFSSYTLTVKNQKEKLRKQSHLPFNKMNKPIKETKELYSEKYKLLIKFEIKDRWRDIPCFWTVLSVL